ncbi:MAG: GGDEF domain-containing protein [Burkholderiaceae bacterium]
MFKLEPSEQPPLTNGSGQAHLASPDPVLSWDALLQDARRGLQHSEAACLDCGDPALATRVQRHVREALGALERLGQMMEWATTHCRHLERGSRDALTALAFMQAELAGIRAGERHARHLALHDALTALPNARYFRERLEHALQHGDGRQTALALLYLDLNGFKAINDAHGHEVGDELLKVVASRLSRVVRSEDMISRLGGDEFACLRQGGMSQQQLIDLALKLNQTIAAPMKLGALRLSVTASIGISQCPADGCNVADLLRHADAAMYSAKREGRCYAFYEAGLGGPSQFAEFRS